MTDATIWWLLAGIAIVAELLSGTFFLLMLSIGMAAAALAASTGASSVVQILTAAATGGGAVLIWYRIKKKRSAGHSARADRSVNLDIGETIYVSQWLPDGTANVKYRGANWTAIHHPHHSPLPGFHRVTEMVGNRLLVTPVEETL